MIYPGGVLGLEKGTDLGPTAMEQWLSRPKMAIKKKGGGVCPLIILYKKEGCHSICLQYPTSNNNCMHSDLLLKPFKTIIW